ncbi:hypothetical protein [Parasphingorhabdus sp.]|uniref:hypothetical protein n=1 Tax=Parasphingorhabdus sp. TaxID=2709688 RepID=UPI002F955523
MRFGFVLLAVFTLLSACQQEPDFEERYKEQSEILEEQGRLIEKSVEHRLKAAEEAATALGQDENIEPSRSIQDQ